MTYHPREFATSAAGSSAPPRPDDLLTVAEAAPIARRSIRTLRRAYRSGTLRAHKDGNGRGIRIEYADLREWMRRDGVVPTGHDTRRRRQTPAISTMERPRATKLAENLKRLEAARARKTRSRRRNS
jgi:excisionase family DNA binding protein